MIIYTTAGIMYAIAGWLLAGKTGGASTSMGMGYELEAIAACTIGGVSTTGGIGTVSGVLVGVLVFELLKIVLQFLGVNPYYNYIVQGIVIVVAVALDVRKYLGPPCSSVFGKIFIRCCSVPPRKQDDGGACSRRMQAPPRSRPSSPPGSRSPRCAGCSQYNV